MRRLRAENTFPISPGRGARAARARRAADDERARRGRARPPAVDGAHVAELEAAGLVARRPHPLDRRQILIELTERGRAKLADDRRRREGWLARRSGRLTAEEQETLGAAIPLLRRLTQS